MVITQSEVILDLNENQLKQLCIITGFKKAKKGEIIYFSSSELSRVFLLKKGNIKIVSVDEIVNLKSILMEITT